MPGQPVLPPDATPTASDQALLDAVFNLQSSVNNINTTIEGIGITPETLVFGVGIITALAFIAGIRSAGMFVFLLFFSLASPGLSYAINAVDSAQSWLDGKTAVGIKAEVSESSTTLVSGSTTVDRYYLDLYLFDTSLALQTTFYSMTYQSGTGCDGSNYYACTRTYDSWTVFEYCDGSTTTTAVNSFNETYSSSIKENLVTVGSDCSAGKNKVGSFEYMQVTTSPTSLSWWEDIAGGCRESGSISESAVGDQTTITGSTCADGAQTTRETFFANGNYSYLETNTEPDGSYTRQDITESSWVSGDKSGTSSTTTDSAYDSTGTKIAETSNTVSETTTGNSTATTTSSSTLSEDGSSSSSSDMEYVQNNADGSTTTQTTSSGTENTSDGHSVQTESINTTTVSDVDGLQQTVTNNTSSTTTDGVTEEEIFTSAQWVDTDASDGITYDRFDSYSKDAEGNEQTVDYDRVTTDNPDGSSTTSTVSSDETYDKDGALIDADSMNETTTIKPDGSVDYESTTTSKLDETETAEWNTQTINSSSTPAVNGDGFNTTVTATDIDTYANETQEGTKITSSSYDTNNYSDTDFKEFELVNSEWVETKDGKNITSTDLDGTKTENITSTPTDSDTTTTEIVTSPDGYKDTTTSMTDSATNTLIESYSMTDGNGITLANSTSSTDLNTDIQTETINIYDYGDETPTILGEPERTTTNVNTTSTDGVDTVATSTLSCYWYDGIEICGTPVLDDYVAYDVEVQTDIKTAVNDNGETVTTTTTTTDNPLTDEVVTTTTTVTGDDLGASPGTETPTEQDPLNISVPGAAGVSMPDTLLLSNTLDSTLEYKEDTFTSIYERHKQNWVSGDMFVLLDNFSLALPSALPVFTLDLPRWGVQHEFDFNLLSWVFDIVRALVILSAFFYAYKIVFRA